VFAVVREWIAQDRPRTNETRHDFREWAGVLDWIVQHICRQAPLLDGHQAAQDRVSNPALTFLRKLALAVADQGRTGERLIASELYEIAEAAGVDVPGMRAPDESHGKRQVGIVLGRLFKDGNTVAVDTVAVTREEVETQREDGGTYTAKSYTFTTTTLESRASTQGAQDVKCSEKHPHFSGGIRSCAACADVESTTPTEPPELPFEPETEAALSDTLRL
jgi:hypothetical protein